MKAAPADQLRLLDLQAVDLTLDQLAHRRRTLPEHAEIERTEKLLPTLRDAVTRVEMTLGDLDRQITRLEVDIDQVRQRAARDKERMDSGAVTASRELESLQHEVASLARRQSELEDSELELLELREAAEAEHRAAAGALAEATAGLAELSARREVAEADVDAQVTARTGERAPLASPLPADLLALYERIRTNGGGIGAAALRARRCGGCRIELSGTDLEAARKAEEDEVLRCEECGRILVRTAESGL